VEMIKQDYEKLNAKSDT